MKERMTVAEFIARVEARHGKGRYDFSQMKFAGTMKPITIICRQHGPFSKRRARILYYGTGCPTCGGHKPQIETADALPDDLREALRVTLASSRLGVGSKDISRFLTEHIAPARIAATVSFLHAVALNLNTLSRKVRECLT
jgi:hypothetical protein